MARIRARDTAPEVATRRALWAAGLRYRLRPDLPGTPDLAFVGARLAVFVDGCFWHGCPQHYSFPATRQAFWAAKLRRNVDRDGAVDAGLGALGWTSLRLWEHDLVDLAAAVRRVRALLRPDDPAVVAAADRVAEAPAAVRYAAPPLLGPWYACACGSDDVRVLAVSNPGGLSPRSRRPVERAVVRCRACGAERQARVRHALGTDG